MIMRNILLLIMAVTLAACRANPPRSGTETQVARAPVVESNSGNSEESARAAAQTTSGESSYLAGDGPGTATPSHMDQTPDAVPHAEPLHRYANRPYTVLGKNYTPLTKIGSYKKQGMASWYGKKFHGQKTAIGEIYDMYGMSAAHTTLPIPSYARVTNLANNKSVILRINDRGPFLHERIIDLSYAAASKLGIIDKGQAQVEVESLTPDENTASPIYKEPIQVSPLPSAVPATSGVYLQLGAFNSQSGAEEFLRSMRTKLSNTGKQLSLSHRDGMVKVRIGPYANADTARANALDLQSRLGFKPVLSSH